MQVSCMTVLEGPVVSVLRKTYQSNWRKIFKQCLSEDFIKGVATKIQETLSICDGDDEATDNIKDFANKVGEVAFQMFICDPPLCMDMSSIG